MNEKETDMELQALGEAIGRGIVERVTDYIFIIIVLAACLSGARAIFGWGMDDSDESSLKRSGLAVHTDHKTGLQYLSDGHGGLILRGGQTVNLSVSRAYPVTKGS